MRFSQSEDFQLGIYYAPAPSKAPFETAREIVKTRFEDRITGRVQGVAAGLGLVDRRRLQLSLVLSRAPGEGVDSGAGGAPR